MRLYIVRRTRQLTLLEPRQMFNELFQFSPNSGKAEPKRQTALVQFGSPYYKANCAGTSSIRSFVLHF
jgi:hypothetical protein